jgi:hypothetical protein
MHKKWQFMAIGVPEVMSKGNVEAVEITRKHSNIAAEILKFKCFLK